MKYKKGDVVRCINTGFICSGKIGVIKHRSGLFWHVDYPDVEPNFPNFEDELELSLVVGEQLIFDFGA